VYGDALPAGILARLGSERLFVPRASFFALSADGRLLAVSNTDGTLSVWEASTGRQLWCTDRPAWPADAAPLGRLLAMSLSPDGRVVALARPDKSILLYEAGTGREIRKLQGGRHTLFMAFHPSGQMLAAGWRDGPVEIWDPGQGKIVGQCGNFPSLAGLAFSADGETLTVYSHIPGGARTLEFSIWHVPSGKKRAEHRLQTDSRYLGALSPDGRAFALPTQDGKTIRLIDTTKGTELCRTEGQADWPVELAFCHDGRCLAASSHDGVVRVWERRSGRMLHQFKALASSVEHVALSGDGRFLALKGPADQAVHLWDLTRGKELQAFAGHRAGRLSVAFGRGGKTLATSGPHWVSGWSPNEWDWRDWSLREWDADSGRELRATRVRLPGHAWFTSFSPDGRLAVVVLQDGRLGLWDVSLGRQVRTWTVPTREHTSRTETQIVDRWHTTAISAPVFSPDGRIVYAVGQAIYRWDVATGKELSSLRAPARGTLSLPCFPTPDDRGLLVPEFGPRIHLLDRVTGRDLTEFGWRHVHPRRGG
jgi:WD40 repeat protein